MRIANPASIKYEENALDEILFAEEVQSYNGEPKRLVEAFTNLSQAR
jgi:hypothetical protein